MLFPGESLSRERIRDLDILDRFFEIIEKSRLADSIVDQLMSLFEVHVRGWLRVLKTADESRDKSIVDQTK